MLPGKGTGLGRTTWDVSFPNPLSRCSTSARQPHLSKFKRDSGKDRSRNWGLSSQTGQSPLISTLIKKLWQQWHILLGCRVLQCLPHCNCVIVPRAAWWPSVRQRGKKQNLASKSDFVQKNKEKQKNTVKELLQTDVIKAAKHCGHFKQWKTIRNSLQCH